MTADYSTMPGVASLRRKVLVPFFVILIALGTTATVGSLYVIRDSMIRTADERLGAIQQQVYREIRTLEAEMQHKAILLELSYRIDNNLHIPADDISRIDQLVEDSLVAKNLRAQFIDPAVLEQFSHPSLKEMFNQARTSQKTRIRFTTDLGPTPSLSLVAPVVQNQQVVQYILLQSSVDQPYLNEIAEPLHVNISLFDIDGESIVRSHDDTTSYELSSDLLEQTFGGEMIYTTNTGLISNRIMYSVIPLGTTDILLLEIDLPLTSIDNLIAVFFTRSALTLLAALLIGGYIYFRLVSRITRPVENMLSATHAIAEGNLDHRLNEDQAGEFGQLAESFNNMMASLSTVYEDRLQKDRELTIAQEELRYKDLLEEKNREIEAANAELGSQNKELSVLLKINQEMSTTLDLNSLFDKVLTSLMDLIDCQGIILLTYNQGAEVLEVSHALGIDKADLADVTFKLSEGISGETARTRTLSYVPDLKVDKRYLSYKKSLTVFGSMVSIPLVTHNKLCGVLNLHKDKLNGFDDDEINLSLAVGSQAAIAIENAQLYKQAKELSITDELTGLANRRHFQDILDREIVLTKRYTTSLSVIMIDIDHFKKYNDFHGHLQGDMVLKKVAKALLDNTRGIDLVSRFGGEEFVILLPKTNTDGAMIAAEKLRQVVEAQPFEGAMDSQPGGRITLSLGVATFPDDTADAQHLIELADQALYQAKEQGRNRALSFTALHKKA